MSDTATVRSGGTLFVEASSAAATGVANAGPDTVYYKATNNVSSSDTALASGANVSLTSPMFFTSAGTSKLTIQFSGTATAPASVPSDAARITDLEAKRFVQTRFPIFGPLGGLGFQLDRLQTTYATPTAFSASSMQLYAVATATVAFAQVQFIWTPNATGCGLRLIQFDGGPVNIVQIAEATGHPDATPIPTSVDITTAVQALAPGGGKYLGWQFKGDGVVGPLVYAVWVDIVWSV